MKKSETKTKSFNLIDEEQQQRLADEYVGQIEGGRLAPRPYIHRHSHLSMDRRSDGSLNISAQIEMPNIPEAIENLQKMIEILQTEEAP